METLMIQSAGHMPTRPNISLSFRSRPRSPLERAAPTDLIPAQAADMNAFANETSLDNLNKVSDIPFGSSNVSGLYSGLLYDPANSSLVWTGGDFINATISDGNRTLLADLDYSSQAVNTTDAFPPETWHFCKDWTPTQHNLYQTANFLLAAAFLIPGSFKQSVLLVRALFSLGYLLLSIWAGNDVCSLDLLFWNTTLMLLNLGHTVFLTLRFLPPTLTLELTELYLKVFRPLRVSKKHFKELVHEAHVVSLEQGDIYAVEDVSPADERLSILLRGKLRVTCDDTHMHFINAHQFLDSPEWEANHEHSDDVFQVTITAEEDCVFLSWPRMRLERVLRHRPMLKVVLDCIIGKDITQKLYSLNEHLSGLDIERERSKRDELWASTYTRSVSMDAVDTGTTGLVRSHFYKEMQRKHSLNSATLMGTIKGLHSQVQCWIPVVANHFPPVSPFIPIPREECSYPVDATSTTQLLQVPEMPNPATPKHAPPSRKSREVKFVNY